MLQNLSKQVRHFSEEQNMLTLEVLVEVFTDKGVRSDRPLQGTVESKYSDHKVMAVLQQHPGMLQGLEVRHLRAVIKVFLDKIAVCDWLTAHIADYMQAEIPQDLLMTIELRFRNLLKQKGAREIVDELEEVLEMAEQCTQESLQPTDDLTLVVEEKLTWILQDDELLAVHSFRCFEGLKVAHLVALIRFLRKKNRRLRSYINAQVWSEPGAELTELPVILNLADVDADITHDKETNTVSVNHEAFGWELEDAENEDKDRTTRCMVAEVRPDSAAEHAGVTAGMTILRIGDVRVSSWAEVKQLFLRLPHRADELCELSVKQAAEDDDAELHRAETNILMEESSAGLERTNTLLARGTSFTERGGSFTRGLTRGSSFTGEPGTPGLATPSKPGLATPGKQDTQQAAQDDVRDEGVSKRVDKVCWVLNRANSKKDDTHTHTHTLPQQDKEIADLKAQLEAANQKGAEQGRRLELETRKTRTAKREAKEIKDQNAALADNVRLLRQKTEDLEAEQQVGLERAETDRSMPEFVGEE